MSVYVPRHVRRETGDWPHQGCDKAEFIDDQRHPSGCYALKVYRRTEFHGPDAPVYNEVVMNIPRHDGIEQADGTRAFPIDGCFNTFHEHPDGKCPSEPAAALAPPMPPAPTPATTVLADTSRRPHLILLKGEKAA